MFELVAFLLLLILSSLFSGGETAFTLLDKVRLRLEAQEGNRKARLLVKLWDRPELFFTPLLVGNNLANIACTVIITALFVRLMGEIGALVSTIVVTLLILYFGELLPKTLAARYPTSISRVLFYPLLCVFVLIAPVSLIINSGLRALHRVVPGLKDRGPLISREGMEALAESWEKRDLGELLGRALRFSRKTLGEIMVPRVEIKAFPADMPVIELLKQCKELRYSRLPLFKGTLDQVVGVLYIKDLLGWEPEEQTKAIELSRVPFFLVENLTLLSALKEMRAKKASLALVVDEYGGISGLVTLEDMIEEIMGEIWDEHDQPFLMIQGSVQGLIVDAHIPLEELKEKYNISLESQAVSLGGFLEEMAGKIPSPGQEFRAGNVVFRVTEASRKAVRRVLIKFPNQV